MQRRERSLPPPISTAQAELAVVKQRLMEMDKALRAERLARSQLAAKAKAEISSLRRELENTGPAGPDPATRAAVRFGGSLAFSVIAIAVAAAVAGFSVWYVDP
ncbi:MAG TPA: hypothetical protein VEF06_06595, partial [Bryobacteraceae bacterium]|nr:hypothetical protein [Bryobacteraceae bacterium]